MNKKGITSLSSVTIRVICVVVLIMALTPEPVIAAGTCGTGTWAPGNLEIHHINIGQGDATFIVGPTGKSLLFDAGESYWNSSADAQTIGPYIETVLGCKELDYVVVSHFHVDHVGYVGYGGLYHLVETQGFTVGSTLVRDYNTYLGDISSTFTNWKAYLEGAGQAKLHPVTAMEGISQVDIGSGVAFDIVAVDGNGAIIPGDFSGDASPPSENDYSIGAVISYGNFDEWVGGDLDGQYEIGGFGYTYHDIELSVAPEVGDVDVYKANHHASSHSSSATFINQIDPEVSIVTVGDGNTYGHPTQSIMDRLLTTSTVYMTERGDTNTNVGSAIVAGNIVIKTSDGSSYTVNGTSYTATEPTRTDNDNDGYFAEVDPNDNNSGMVPAPNGGCGPIYQTCSVSCQVNAGQVFINEVLPAPSSGPEWVELHNTTSSAINLGYCFIDDIVAGSAAYQIPAGTLIPAHGFWTLDRTSYFNNTGDDVRFLKEDGITVLDSYTYGNTGSDLSWYRFPDGGVWAISPTASTTKGLSNNTPVHPVVLASTRANPNPTSAASVNFTVTFSKSVTGVDVSEFKLTPTGITGALIVPPVSGSGTTYTVTVNTGSGNGTVRLDVVDEDSIIDASGNPLGGVGKGNGNYTSGEVYTISKFADVNVTIGGNPKGSYTVYPVPAIKTNYPNTLNGPVKVISTNDQSIFTSQRAFYGSSFNELMGYPADQFTTEYWFPWYDNVYMQTWILVGNPSDTQTAYVDIYIGADKTSYTIPPGDRVTPQFPNQLDGPVRVVSTIGAGTPTPIPIFTSERSLYGTSFSEVMGYPADQFTTEYWFPWYDQVYMQTWILVGNPSASQTAYVDIYIGADKTSYTIPPNGRITPQFPNKLDGPVRVVSTSGAGTPTALPIFTSERSLYGSSFNEVMGYPASQFTTDYWFTWYDNASMQTWILVGNPSATQTAYVDIIIHGVTTSYAIPANGRITPQFNVSNGPVHVASKSGVGTPTAIPIFTSERSLYGPSFNEMMGYPGDQLTSEYWFTWYDNIYMKTDILIGKP